jgi:hypothetical protein
MGLFGLSSWTPISPVRAEKLFRWEGGLIVIFGKDSEAGLIQLITNPKRRRRLIADGSFSEVVDW